MLKALIEFLYRGFFGDADQAVGHTTEASPTFSMVCKDITQVTVVLDKELAEGLEGLASEMQTNVHDVLIRMLKIANVIRSEKLYGIPSVSGNYLGVANHKTNEFLRINLDCPVKGEAPKQELPPKENTKKWTN